MAYLLFLAFPFAMAFAAASDVMTMRIPNAVSLGIGALFLLAAASSGMLPSDVLVHLGVSAAVLLAGMLLFSLNLMGGGDSKLLAAAALWIGPGHLLMFLVLVTVFGGVLAVLIASFRRLPARSLPLPDWAVQLHAPGSGIPYGVAITAGALTVYPATPWAALVA